MNLHFEQEQCAVVEAEEKIRKIAPSDSWVIAQSFTEIQFDYWNGQFEIAFARILSGRIFGEEREVRWVNDDGKTTIWNLTGKGDGDPVKYYLWGIYDAKIDGFREAVVRKLKPNLPVKGPFKSNARPYIEVYECPPDRPAGTLTPEALTKALNQPRIAAHRFVRVGCDAGGKKNA